jgi:hypothetical protein
LFYTVPSEEVDDLNVFPSLYKKIVNNPIDKLNLPSVAHFAGMRFNPSRFFPTSKCETKHIHLYNVLGQTFFLSTNNNSNDLLSNRRLIVSVTTTQKRLFALHETIITILQQTILPTLIYLNIPINIVNNSSNKEALSHLKSLSSKVFLNPSKDEGPATKLLPTLRIEKNPATLLITIDDDMLYKPLMIEILLRHFLNYPYAAFGFAGQMIDNDGVVRSADEWSDKASSVDILEAFLGAIYRRDFFDDYEVYKINNNNNNNNNYKKECFSCDDIWFSAQLANASITRIKLAELSPHNRPSFSKNDVISPLRSLNVFGKNEKKKSFNKNDVCAKKLLFLFKKTWLKTQQHCTVVFNEIHYKHVLSSKDKEQIRIEQNLIDIKNNKKLHNLKKGKNNNDNIEGLFKI